MTKILRNPTEINFFTLQTESWKVIGAVRPSFAKKYGLNPDAQMLVWSGDNTCSVICLGPIQEGNVAVSLGTSYTYFGYIV